VRREGDRAGWALPRLVSNHPACLQAPQPTQAIASVDAPEFAQNIVISTNGADAGGVEMSKVRCRCRPANQPGCCRDACTIHYRWGAGKGVHAAHAWGAQASREDGCWAVAPAILAGTLNMQAVAGLGRCASRRQLTGSAEHLQYSLQTHLLPARLLLLADGAGHHSWRRRRLTPVPVDQEAR
jgi:hypothetical protein